MSLLPLLAAATVCGAAAGDPPADRRPPPNAVASHQDAAASLLQDPAEVYRLGVTFPAFLDRAENLVEVWRGNWEAARVPEDVLPRVAALPGAWHLLVVAADGCQDSANSIPFLARFAEEVEGVELRMVEPDLGRPLMEARPTPDGRAATPTVILLDDEMEEVGCWIERPARQQMFYLSTVTTLDRSTPAFQEAVRDFFGWYREDAGRTAVREIVTLMERAATGPATCEALR